MEMTMLRILGYMITTWICVTGNKLKRATNGLTEKAPVAVSDQTQYQSLLTDFWAFRMSDVPEFATTVGVHQYDNKLEHFTPRAFREKERRCGEFLMRLDQIDRTPLSVSEVDNLDILQYQLKAMVEGYTYRKYGAYNPINHLEGVHRDTSLWINAMKFEVDKDFHVYRNRLRALAKQINEVINLMNEAIIAETTYHKVSIERVPVDLDELLQIPAKQTDWFKPYNQSLGHSQVNKANRDSIKEEGVSVIQNNLIPAYRKLRRHIVNDYLAHCRQSITVSSLIGGFEYYCARIKWYMSEGVSPYSLYMRGKQAITDIMERIDHKSKHPNNLMSAMLSNFGSYTGFLLQVKVSVGYIGKLSDFLRHAQGASKFFFSTKDEVLAEYQVIVKEKILALFSSVFHNVSMPFFEIQAMPFDGPDAVMMPGSADMPGVFFVNVNNPYERPKWKMKAIALRETVPGRLLQLTIENKLPLPHFRRHREYRKLHSVPFQYPFHSAYTEGWSLYAESLGYEMNIFLNPYDELGQLFSELHHLSLMVTDTGIHALSWTRDNAIQYLHTTTGISSLQAAQEVDRIITLPGQACVPAYAFMKLKQLKQKSQQRFGSYFNIKDFHDKVLKTGPVPLYFLEQKIDRWIDEEATEYKAVISKGYKLTSNIQMLVLALYIAVTLTKI